MKIAGKFKDFAIVVGIIGVLSVGGTLDRTYYEETMDDADVEVEMESEEYPEVEAYASDSDMIVIKSVELARDIVTETQNMQREYEVAILAKLVHAEAGNQDLKGKCLVARVVMNRVESSDFPNSIEQVVFQDKQFSSVWDGHYRRAVPNESDFQAVNMVLNGWDESKGAMYFEAESNSTWHRNHLIFVFAHGAHIFYK